MTTAHLTVADPATWDVQRLPSGVVIVSSAELSDPQPVDHQARLTSALRDIPAAAAVGARRLLPDGTIRSGGEFVVHPKGYHALGRGMDGQCYRFPEEVDAVAGGIVAIDGDAFDAVDGAAVLETGGTLGLVELCLRLRLDGGRVITIPDATVIDDSDAHVDAAARDRFRQRFGFDCLAADLAEVRRRYPNSGLLWNVRWHGQAMPFEKYDRRGSMHWQSYQQVDPYRRRADHLVAVVHRITPEGSILDLGCGDGLFTHLLAAASGLEVVGIDPEPAAIEHANAAVSEHRYTGPAPRFIAASGEDLPLEPGSVSTVAMFDVIEHLPNPAPVLQACSAVLRPGGSLVCTTPAWQYGRWSDPVYHVTEYTLDELTGQICAATDLEVADTGRIGGVYRDVVVVARKPG